MFALDLDGIAFIADDGRNVSYTELTLMTGEWVGETN